MYDNNNMLPPHQSKMTRGKLLWESTKRWIHLRSRVKAEQFIPPSYDANLADYAGLDSNYNMETQQLRLFVGTWNVAGKTPTDEWVVQEWLCSHEEAADIYVLGFQEIVPLNAGNVLGNEDKGVSARKWDELIMRTLNESSMSSSDTYSCNYWSSDSGDLANMRSSSATTPSSPSSIDDNTFHACDDGIMGSNTAGGALLRKPTYGILHSMGATVDVNARRHSSAEESCHINWDFYSTSETSSTVLCSDMMPSIPSHPYIQIASRQMVGLFTSVWIRRDLYRHVKAVEVSTVGCGIMGCLGNKGSISVSLSIHGTNFCFICSHLKPGDTPNDIIRRNSDVHNILQRTRFHRSRKLAALNLPRTILSHDRIIWFGDLNYRVSLPCKELKSLVTKGDWANLLQKDQLKCERGRGGVLEGWSEGPICFPPTYKYVPNSDAYIFMQHPQPHNTAQKRAPAWCDRILWYGKGLKQLYYTSTSALRLSDHRPVSAMFMAEVETMLRQPLVVHDIIPKNSKDKTHTSQSTIVQSQGDYVFPSLFGQMLAHDSKCRCLRCKHSVKWGSIQLETS